MKILFVLEHYFPYIGGVETLFQSLTESLVKEGHSVLVVTTRFDKSLAKAETINGVKIQRVSSFNRYFFSLFSLPSVIRAAKDVDLIHTTTYNAAFPAWLAAKIRGKKILISFHEVWDQLWFQLPFTSRLNKYAYYLYEQFIIQLPFDHYVAVSDFTKESLQKRKIAAEKITRIYNGIDYREFEDYQAEKPVYFRMLFYGRLGISKGLDILIPALANFRKNHPSAKAIFILPKRPKAILYQIESLLREHELEEFVEIKHELERTELFQEIANSSCVVIPSYSEGFCFAAVESGALAVPVISSGKGALSETVSGEHIVMRRFTTNELWNALEMAHDQKWSITPQKKFNLSDTVARHLKLYDRLTEQ